MTPANIPRLNASTRPDCDWPRAEDHTDVHRATVNLLASAAYQACWLGQHHEAEPYLTPAPRRAGRQYPRDRMLFASDLAHARLHTGDITGACEATHHALELSQHVASPRVFTWTRFSRAWSSVSADAGFAFREPAEMCDRIKSRSP